MKISWNTVKSVKRTSGSLTWAGFLEEHAKKDSFQEGHKVAHLAWHSLVTARRGGGVRPRTKSEGNGEGMMRNLPQKSVSREERKSRVCSVGSNSAQNS